MIARKHDGGQGYYNRSDQQFIARKQDSGLERVTIELVPNLILEKEEDSFYQGADNYDQWDNTSYTPVEEDEMGVPTHLMLTTVFSTSEKPNKIGKSKTRIVSEVSESNNKSDFYIGKRQS